MPIVTKSMPAPHLETAMRWSEWGASGVRDCRRRYVSQHPPKAVLDLKRQHVHSEAHVHHTGCEPHQHLAGHRNHPCPRT